VGSGGRDADSAASPAPAGPPGAEEIVRRARAAYDSLRTLKASFVQVLEMRVFDPPRRKEGRGTWYQKKPSLLRMDFAEPEGDLIVSDGRHLWLHYPSSHPGQVIRSDLQAPGRGAAIVDLQGRIFRQARTTYRPRLEDREEVGGRMAHVVVLEPRSSGTPYREVWVWVDVQSHLVRRLRFHDRSETVRTITLDDLRPGVSLSDTLFRFEPPPDAEVFEG
jgi:outer membrane lipoprotein-sorting protein